MAAEPITAAQPIVVTLDAKLLGKCLAACLKHAAHDGTRPALERIHIVPKEGGVLFECTDGFRALRWTVPAPSLHADGAVSYQLGYEQARAIYATLPKAGPYDLELQPCESPFPDLERLVPQMLTHAVFNAKYLADALAACKASEYVCISLSTPKTCATLATREFPAGTDLVTVLLMPAS